MSLRRAIAALVPLVFLAALCPGSAGALASGWTTQLTLPSGYIYAATFASPDVVWAAGSGGIFRSVDAGRSWSLAYNSPQPLSAISAAPDGMHGWAVGAVGVIVATIDGGVTWQRQASGSEVNLLTVAALGNGRAIAAGVGSGFSDVVMEPQPHVILQTDDGGASWAEIHLDTDYEARTITFLTDSIHGWMAADRCVPPVTPPGAVGCDPTTGATVLRSDDGGASWTPVGHDVSLYSVQFVSASAGWATGYPAASGLAELLRTTDGGVTWKQVRPTAPSAFFAFDAQHAIAAERRSTSGYETQLVETGDGGATWHDLGTPVQRFVAVMRFSSTDAGVMLGDGALWTANGGSAWHDAQFPVVVGSGAIDFVDASHGWLAASELLRTDDGGATWRSVSSNAFAEIAFVSPAEGWATRAACSGACTTTVSHTTDGGAKWTQQFATTVPDTAHLVFTTRSDGWLLFESEGRALHTRDGGATWYDQQLPTKPGNFGNTGSAIFVDGTVGWAAIVECEPAWTNCHDRVYRTVDGGDTWSPVSDFAAGECYASSMATTDARHVWIEGGSCLGNQYTLYRSDDGGSSWTAAPLVSHLMSVTFFDATTGRAIADACAQQGGQQVCASRLARTSDGGTTWVPDAATVGANPYGGSGVEFASPEHVWLVANGGGGAMALSSQTVFAYAGVEPSTQGRRPVIAPTTGTGAAAASDVRWPFVVLLAAIGATLVALGMRLRRINRRAEMRASDRAPGPRLPTSNL